MVLSLAGHLAVRLDAMLEAVELLELPAGVTGLDAGLAHVKRDGFAHCEVLVGGGEG